MPAPKGNTNSSLANREWSNAIRRAVARRDKTKGSGLNELADALLDKVLSGDTSAIKEFGDRYEGKVPTVLEGTGPNGAITVITSKEDGSVL